MVEEQLYEMQQYQGREERIQMHIERVAPLHVEVAVSIAKVAIRNHPKQRGHDHAAEYAVNKHDVQCEQNRLQKP